MLADEILVNPGTVRGAGDAFLDLDRFVREAHRFDLSAGFASAVNEIRKQQSNQEALRAVRGLCRLPYHSCWIEVAQSNRQSSGTIAADQAPIKRIGFLMHARSADFLAFDIHQFYLSSTTGIAIPCALSVAVDCSGRNTIAAMLESKGVDRGIDFGGAVDVGLYSSPFASEINALAERSGQKDQFLRAAKKDWDGEVGYVLAVLSLINSPRVAKITNAQNASRKHSGGKKELLSYRICDINVDGRSIGNQTKCVTHGDTRAHFVRGHFKMRASGIFWWAPFIRGNHTVGFVTKSYSVKSEQSNAA